MRVTSKTISTNLNWKGVGLLLGIIIVVLAISMMYPFFKFTERFTERFTKRVTEPFTNEELPAMQTALQTFSTSNETICQEGVETIHGIKTLSQTDSIAMSPIFNDQSGRTNAWKITQIISINSTNHDLLSALNTIQGKQYAALLTLLQALPQKSSDEGFNKILGQQIKAPIIGTDPLNSSYGILNKYVQNSAAKQ